MKLKLFSGAALVAALIIPTTANAQVFDRNVLIGAGLGGVIGSNLAGGGVQDEGTAIGAVLGGLAGAAFSNRSNHYSSGHGYNTGFQGGIGGQPYFGGAQYGTYGGSYGHMPLPAPAPHYVNSGQFMSNTYVMPSTRTHYYQPAPQIVHPPKVTHIYHPAPRVEPIIHRVVHHVPAATKPQIKTVHIYKPAPAPLPAPEPAPVYISQPAPVYAPAPAPVALPAPQPSGVYCYAGSSKRYDSYGHEIKTNSSTCSR